MMIFKYAVELGHSSLTMNSLQCAVKTVPCTLHVAQPMQDPILFRRQSKLFRILPFSICNPVICGERGGAYLVNVGKANSAVQYIHKDYLDTCSYVKCM